MSTTTWSFHYGVTSVKDIRIAGTRQSPGGKTTVTGLELAGEQVQPTRRFWKSFFNRFGVSDNVFRYFEPSEVFHRISSRSADDSLRYCIERNDQGGRRILAVSSPKRPVIDYDQVATLIRRYDGRDVHYDSGIVTSTHAPRSGDRTFTIGADRFQHRFVMETPIDGFSHPKLYLSFLRLICSNGAIGYSQAFRSDVSLGKDIGHCIARALESYDNGDGYAALRQRFESAQKSWASVRECVQLYKTVMKLGEQCDLEREALLRSLYRTTGNLNEIYGLANLDALSTKRQRILPARCRVYDLINFASETATHHATPIGNRAMQAFIGSLISDEYDMEGTAEAVGDFQDFFVESPATGPSP
ncbi:MAG: DUF932 domain-containing protein [Planctomycetes bacterium]|nr:DUF932 domain-containing protein [Planctomycetota bacterium]